MISGSVSTIVMLSMISTGTEVTGVISVTGCAVVTTTGAVVVLVVASGEEAAIVPSSVVGAAMPYSGTVMGTLSWAGRLGRGRERSIAPSISRTHSILGKN